MAKFLVEEGKITPEQISAIPGMCRINAWVAESASRKLADLKSVTMSCISARPTDFTKKNYRNHSFSCERADPALVQTALNADTRWSSFFLSFLRKQESNASGTLRRPKTDSCFRRNDKFFVRIGSENLIIE
ncbi:hypothetical protein [Desulfonema magnum]|uniref:hypothetical protein n=1 Tax=Desulfonema magnum TaxID=45655 RepID=UPI001A9BB5F0|nr:hypothetical protein [Desulfonema magnum]